jgi:hypothetical protein
MSRLFSLSTPAIVAVALFAPVTARAVDDPKDIIAKAIKAHGGEESLSKYKAAQTKTKGKIDIPGVGEADFTQETSYMLPDKFRDSLDISIMGKNIPVVTLLNGDNVSIEVDGKALDLNDELKATIKDVRHILEIGQLVALKDKKYELNLIGEDKVEGKKVVGIRISAKNQKDVSLYFDKETGLLAKIEYRTADVTNGNEVNEERIVTEYTKDKDGVPVPKKVLVKREGKKLLEAEVLEFQRLEKIDDSVFKK